MIVIPVWAAVLVVGSLFPVGLWCYWFGWNWRGRFEASRFPPSFRSSRPLTAAEEAKMRESFEHMERGFQAMDEAFGDFGRYRK